MADKGDVSLIITGDITSLEQVMEKAGQLIESKMSSIVSGVSNQFARLTERIAAAFAIKELVDFVNGVAEARAHLDQLSQSTGTSVENLSQIQAVTKVLGGNIDDVAGAMEKLVRGLATGDGETGKAANALAYLGISARNSDGSLKDAGDLYKEIALKFAGIGDGAGKTALAIDLFGKSGAAQIPVLNALGQAGDTVAKVTDDQARAAENYERDLNALALQLGENKRTLATELIPVADDFVRSLMGMISGTNGLTGELKQLQADGSLKEWGRDAALVAASVIDLFAKVVQTFKAVGSAIGGVAAATVAAMSGDFDQASAIVNDIDGQVAKIFSGPTMEDRLRNQFALSDDAAKIDFGKASASWDKASYTGTGKGKGKKPEDDSKALLAVQRAQQEAAANLQKEQNKEAEQANDDLYKHNLESIQAFYATKTALEQASLQAEIDAKTQEIAAAQAGEATATTEKARLGIKADEIKLTGQLAVLQAQQSNVAVVNARAQADAEQKLFEALQNVKIASEANIGNAQVAQEKLALDQRKAMRQVSDADAIQEEIGFENQLTAIQAKAIQDRIALEQAGNHDPVKLAELNAQLEELERQHQQRLTQLDNEAVQERNKYAIQAAQAVQDNFATFFDDLTDRTKKLSDTFKSLGQNLLKSFNDIESKKLAEQLFGSGTSGGGMLNSLMQQLFPATAGGSGKTAAGVIPSAGSSNDVAGFTALESAAASTSTSLTQLSDTGIAGMFKSATDWITKQVSGTVTQVTQNTTVQTATTALAAFTQAIYSATTALSSGQATGGSGSGGGSLGGLFGSASSGGSTASAAQVSQADSMAASASELSAQGSIPWLAEGTDFVPQDMLAMIHKGERVTPAKFNNDRTRTAPIYQTVNVPATNSRASAAQAAGLVAISTAAAMRRNA